MTAPGDLVLISVLVALFVASCGYAAGRLHQRYQLRQDREEAYRDGYETASSRVFSLAARIASPRRGARPARGAASVSTVAPVSPVAPANRTAPESPTVPVGPVSPVGSAGPVGPPSEADSPNDPGRAVRHQGVPGPAVPHSRRAQDPPAAVAPGNPVGFPAPTPPPPHTLPEPTAVGGLHFQPLRDPRPADGSGPRLGRRGSPAGSTAAGSTTAGSESASSTSSGSAAAGSTSAGSTSAGSTSAGSTSAGSTSAGSTSAGSTSSGGTAAGSTSTSSASGRSTSAGGTSAGPPGEDSPGGKHTVPDELVRAATYRLPPDRVFRAKVPNSTPLPEQTTTHLSVPKPRRRTDDNVVPPS
ncbi:hypothetical protein [Actinoplanes sp. M2I2]|uniref:hypothetical protein n=1 Tax=Actinoplanes sp. M2I2 TaxID=1734444 RepID=UPI0020209D99|nr:hypothetical protein [Actinoplanes sp. M2I2]